MGAPLNAAPRILIAECLHEICSFNPIPTRYHDFFVNLGPRMLDYHRGIGTEVAGAVEVLQSRPGVTIVPTFSARGITSGGTIPAADWKRLLTEFTAALETAGPVDAAYLTLHGAMAAADEDDPEGALLTRARAILGPDVPIVASFDLHGVLTDRILEQLDALTVYHTYPHVDFFETGQRAARLLLRLLDGEIRPVTAKVEIPALVRGDELITETGIFGQLLTQAQRLEREPGGLSAGFFIGNPFTDVPELRTYSVVTTDGDAEQAERGALELARAFWQERQRMQARLTPLEQSVREALELPATVALVDAADATSSGASGDSNAILRALLAAGCTRRALIPLVDPQAVARAFAAGVGASIEVDLGGALDPRRFTPCRLNVTVRMLSDGRFRSESFGQTWTSGPTAVLESGSLTLVVTSRPVHLFDRSLFYAHGQDPRQFDIVVVKSPHCQHHMYAQWCSRLINVDAPGSTSANLPTLGHTRCRRPVYPLDGDAIPYAPQARRFSRSTLGRRGAVE